MKNVEEIEKYIKGKISDNYSFEVFSYREEKTVINFICNCCGEEEACFLFNILKGESFCPCEKCGEVFLEKLPRLVFLPKSYNNSSEKLLSLNLKKGMGKNKKPKKVGRKKKRRGKKLPKKVGRKPLTEYQKKMSLKKELEKKRERSKRKREDKRVEREKLKKEKLKLAIKEEFVRREKERQRKWMSAYRKKNKRKVFFPKKFERLRKRKDSEKKKNMDWFTDEKKEEFRERFLKNVTYRGIEKNISISNKNKEELIKETHHRLHEDNPNIADLKPTDVVKLICENCGQIREVQKVRIKKSTFKKHSCDAKTASIKGSIFKERVKNALIDVEIFIKNTLPHLTSVVWHIARYKKTSYFSKTCKSCRKECLYSFRVLTQKILDSPCDCYKKKRKREKLIRRVKMVKLNYRNKNNFEIDKRVTINNKNVATIFLKCKKCESSFQKNITAVGNLSSRVNWKNTLFCAKCYAEYSRKRRERDGKVFT